MGITRQQAFDCFASDDLIGIGMEADAVRRSLHPDGIVSYAVEVGGTETATMVFGAGESVEDRVDQLFAIRERQERALQEQTGTIAAFSPISFRPATGRGEFEEPTAVEYLRTLAISRMVLDNIENIESSCVAQGLKLVQMGLRFGANDAGAIDPLRKSSFTEEDLRRVIRDAGFVPVERDTSYRTMFLGN